MRDKQPQAPPLLVQLVLLANIKEQPHQLSTIVQRVLRDRRRPVPPQQLVQIVLQANFKRRLNQRSGLVKIALRGNTRWLLMLVQFAKRVLRDRQRQVQSWLAHSAVLVDSKNYHNQWFTIVNRVLRERPRQVPPQQVAQIVLQVCFRRWPNQLSGLVKIVPRENTVWLLELKLVQFVKRVLRDRWRQVPPQQLAQIVF